VNCVAAEIKLVAQVVADGPHEGGRDKRREGGKVLALHCVEERPIHFVEGGVRPVRLFEDYLYLGIGDLLQLGAAGAAWSRIAAPRRPPDKYCVVMNIASLCADSVAEHIARNGT
jgi:hypothetical protein